MSQFSGNRIVIAITQNAAKVWSSPFNKSGHPETIAAPDEKGKHHHVRQSQHHGGHSSDPSEREFFELIGERLSHASEILLLGHGTGKSNAMDRFIEFLKREEKFLATKVLGSIEADLNSLTDNQILSKARDWFDWYHREGAPISKTIR